MCTNVSVAQAANLSDSRKVQAGSLCYEWSKKSRRKFMSKTPSALLLLLFVAFSSLLPVESRRATANDKLTVAEFEQLHEKLTKMSTERVWSIPWQLSIRKARELAAKENKPVFLWISSNGGTHPLGPC